MIKAKQRVGKRKLNTRFIVVRLISSLHPLFRIDSPPCRYSTTLPQGFSEYRLSFAYKISLTSKYSRKISPTPVTWLKLGSINTMVIQSAQAAVEFFKGHDLAFADRKCPHALTALGYDQELLVTKRINETAHLRQKCVDSVIVYLEEEMAGMEGRLARADLLDPKSKDGPEFYDTMNRVMEWASKPNIADFMPWLKWTRLGHLWYPRPNLCTKWIYLMVQEMFFAGSETTSSTIEWAMTELLRQPESMKKAKYKIDQVVELNRKLEENDTEKMPFLQAVVKETLRLHPPVPLLLPRNALKETKFMGFDIPKDTQVFVNAWSIGRDPDAWEDRLAFKPERFMGSKIDYKGQNFELIPFGSGRRICVGLSLADRVLHLGLATLLYHFDWELGDGSTPKTLDMKERVRIILRKLHPLKLSKEDFLRMMSSLHKYLRETTSSYVNIWVSFELYDLSM
ncbi:hypothetical protein EUGRSUZ_B01207 [Eucalyptus grandis]|uniref:Uncharacterized protein n=2 Tax=Eucalyptus grandis TaxID=71139 RepID=A0ACC3LPL8_EUCGR|nr:hypothetical protein EUGRSUZ_B01207 [Eucalyptus grandis]